MIVGLVHSPVFFVGLELIKSRNMPTVVEALFVLIVFVLPVAVSTIDFPLVMERRRQRVLGMFDPKSVLEDFRVVQLPSLKRGLAWFCGAGVSLMIMEFFEW